MKNSNNSERTTLDELKAFGRYARRLPSFLRDTITPELARERIQRQLARREQSFLTILEGGVYRNPGSPYRGLLEAAGVELADVRHLTAEHGVEGALERLRDAGVYVTLDEFKGRRPIERAGLSLEVGQADFDNPLNIRHLWTRTSGSTSVRRRVPLDLNALEYEASHEALVRSAFGLWGRAFAMYRVRAPSTGGITNMLRQAKLGQPVERWFDPYHPPRDLEALKYGLFMAYTAWAGRLHGARLPRPEHYPVDQADGVARWLERCKLERGPAILDAQAGLAVRVSQAAIREGIDISGTFLRVGGEPLTPAKAEAIEASGCRVVTYYSMTETGRIGITCPNRRSTDDMHLLSDKLAVLRRKKMVGSSGSEVDILTYTTLLPSMPKIMINVESDDFATVEQRSCGCPWDEIGLRWHVHGVRSHEKLTSDGNHFLGSDLFALVEEVLPRRFGGGPTDYQLVEEEVEGLSKVSVVVRPAVGEVSNEAMISAVMDFMRSARRNQLMADFWGQSGSLRVVRREPHVTATGKTPPIHLKHSG